MKYVMTLFLVMGVFFTGIAFAQVDAIPTADEWNIFFQSLSGVGGAGVAGVILICVQGVMLLVRQFVKGDAKLLIVLGLTVAGSIIGGLTSGQTFLAAIVSSGALASAQVFAHQLFKTFKK